MIEAERDEGKDGSGDDPRRQASGEALRQQAHRRPRQRDRAEDQQVVDHHRRRAAADERRRDQPLQQHRVGVGERPQLRVEDVGVDERRHRRERVRDPRDAPDAEQRVVVRRHVRAQVRGLRPGERHGERREQAHHAEGHQQPAHQSPTTRCHNDGSVTPSLTITTTVDVTSSASASLHVGGGRVFQRGQQPAERRGAGRPGGHRWIRSRGTRQSAHRVHRPRIVDAE